MTSGTITNLRPRRKPARPAVRPTTGLACGLTPQAIEVFRLAKAQQREQAMADQDKSVFLHLDPAAVEAVQKVPAPAEPAPARVPWWKPLADQLAKFLPYVVYALLTAFALRFGLPTPPAPTVVVQPSEAAVKDVVKETVKQLKEAK